MKASIVLLGAALALGGQSGSALAHDSHWRGYGHAGYRYYDGYRPRHPYRYRQGHRRHHHHRHRYRSCYRDIPRRRWRYNDYGYGVQFYFGGR